MWHNVNKYNNFCLLSLCHIWQCFLKCFMPNQDSERSGICVLGMSKLRYSEINIKKSHVTMFLEVKCMHQARKVGSHVNVCQGLSLSTIFYWILELWYFLFLLIFYVTLVLIIRYYCFSDWFNQVNIIYDHGHCVIYGNVSWSASCQSRTVSSQVCVS
jgi:hypothetical protein